MHTTLLRTIVAGSFSTLAAVALTAAPQAHAGGGTPDPAPECEESTHIDNGDGTGTVIWFDFCPEVPDLPAPVDPRFQIDPNVLDLYPVLPLVPAADEECKFLAPDQIDVRASQTSPYDWQWRVFLHGPTSNLCDSTVNAVMFADGVHHGYAVGVVEIAAVNAGGDDYIIEFATGCHYATWIDIEGFETPWDSYEGIDRATPDCLGVELPEIPEIPEIDPKIPEVPEIDPEIPADPETPETPEVDRQTPDTPRTPGGDLPSTGSDGTTLLVGGALLVLGAGLAFTAVSMSRRRAA